MLGYRDAEREWLGKVPARLDDLINLAPARLTAAGILAAGATGGSDMEKAIDQDTADGAVVEISGDAVGFDPGLPHAERFPNIIFDK